MTEKMVIRLLWGGSQMFGPGPFLLYFSHPSDYVVLITILPPNTTSKTCPDSSFFVLVVSSTQRPSFVFVGRKRTLWEVHCAQR